jgi:hypothetical protein
MLPVRQNCLLIKGFYTELLLLFLKQYIPLKICGLMKNSASILQRMPTYIAVCIL